MYTKVKNIIFYLIIIFAIYCALIIGQSWDEETYIFLGNERLNYLLSFGANETHEALWGRFFPGISYTLKAFVISLFPGKFEFEINRNLELKSRL